MNHRNFHDFLTQRTRENGSRLVFQKKDGWSWKQVTWPDMLTEVESIACFLLNSGFAPGSRVVVSSPNTLECLFFELAVLMTGGTCVPAAGIGKAKEVLENSEESCFLLSGDPDGARSLATDHSLGGKIEKAFLTVDAKIPVEEETASYSSAVKFGFLARKKLKDEIASKGSSVKETAPAVIFGEADGEAKVFSQADVLDVLRVSRETLGPVSEEEQVFSYLPLCGSFSKFANMLTLQTAARGAVASCPEDFFSDVLEIMPTTLVLESGGLENVVEKLAGSGKSLKKALGGRARLVLTDSAPGEKTAKLLLAEGISALELKTLSAVS